MRLFAPTVEKRLSEHYAEARHALLSAEAEAEVYEAAFHTALLRVTMLRARIARLKAQIEEQGS